MMFNEPRIQLEDCPVCGEKEGAAMGSSSWGHDVRCCSDKCGYIMRDRLRALQEDKKMIRLRKKLAKIQEAITEKVKKVAPNADRFELDSWI